VHGKAGVEGGAGEGEWVRFKGFGDVGSKGGESGQVCKHPNAPKVGFRFGADKALST
jgi:hypothetical protein